METFLPYFKVCSPGIAPGPLGFCKKYYSRA
jgi:hypothetical protein